MDQSGKAEARFQAHLGPAWPLSKWKGLKWFQKGLDSDPIFPNMNQSGKAEVSFQIPLWPVWPFPQRKQRKRFQKGLGHDPIFSNQDQSGKTYVRFQIPLGPAWPFSKQKTTNIILKGFAWVPLWNFVHHRAFVKFSLGSYYPINVPVPYGNERHERIWASPAESEFCFFLIHVCKHTKLMCRSSQQTTIEPHIRMPQHVCPNVVKNIRTYWHIRT